MAEKKKAAPKKAAKKEAPKKARTTASAAPQDVVPVFGLVGHYVKDLSFECPQPAFFLKGGQPKFDLEIGVQTGPVAGREGLYEATVMLRGKAIQGETSENSICYVGELAVTGVFQIQNVPQEQLAAVLAIDGATLVYPFARQIFMSEVINTSYPPPMLGAVDFRQVYAQGQQQQQAQTN